MLSRLNSLTIQHVQVNNIKKQSFVLLFLCEGNQPMIVSLRKGQQCGKHVHDITPLWLSVPVCFSFNNIENFLIFESVVGY